MLKKVIILSLSITFLVLCASAQAVVPAFSGAEGAGKYTVGGRSGVVYDVNNLDDYSSGNGIPGSLRYGVEKLMLSPAQRSNPVTIVFKVSGTIELQKALTFIWANITVAGQTAPGDGITLKNYPIVISTDQVIIRYIRVRLGEKKGTYVNRDSDCMTIQAAYGNIIIDHCSFSWGIDETVSPQSPSTESIKMDKLTVQWCILSNPLNKSVHTEGEHGKATLAYGCYKSRWSFHHNIYAHSMDRNPRLSGLVYWTTDPNGLWFDFRNNVVYNWGGPYPSFSRGVNAVTQVNFVGNYYKSGVNSGGSTYAYDAQDVHGKGYFTDNRMNGTAPGDPWSLVQFSGFTQAQIDAYKQSSEIPIGEYTTTDDSLTAYARVLADVGCNIPYRDSVDRRVVEEIDTGTGEVIDCTTPGNFYYQIGTAQGGTVDTIQLAVNYPGRETGQDNYNVEITGGTGAGQVRFITAFNDATNTFTVTPNWTTIPDATSTYGVIVDCTKNAGGWPTLVSTTPPPDGDHDGMPDAWESARGLNPSSAADGPLDQDSDGYTNVEEYLNYLTVQPTEFPADFDRDGDVDNDDLDLFTEDWLENNCDDVPRRNLDADCDVDFGDYAILADYWMEVY